MMIDNIQRKLKDLCQQIHESLRKQKIGDCFLVGIEFQNKSFILKVIKCCSNFINQESLATPWNHCNHFEEFIAPQGNMSFSLKDNRFNGNTVTLQKLDKVLEVHNVLGEENIKETNYELKMRGKRTLTLFPEGNTQKI